MIGARIALCVLLLASIGMSASTSMSDGWLSPIMLVSPVSSNGQNPSPTIIQPLPVPRPVPTTTTTQTDTRLITSTATLTAAGTLTHPFSSSSSLTHPFSSSSSMTHPFSSSSSHSSAAVELSANLFSGAFVIVMAGSVLAALA